MHDGIEVDVVRLPQAFAVERIEQQPALRQVMFVRNQRAIDQRGERLRRQGCDRGVEEIGIPEVVAVEIGDQFAARQAQAVIARGRGARSGDAFEPHARILQVARNRRWRAVLAAIVHDDQFPVRIALCDHAPDGLADAGFAVAHRHDDADQRLLPVRASRRTGIGGTDDQRFQQIDATILLGLAVAADRQSRIEFGESRLQAGL